MSKAKTTKPGTQFTEPGFEVRSPCGRAWFVPLAAVAQDYIDFLKQADGISQEEAQAKIDEDPSFVETWFCEQFIWEEVERYGTLIKEASAEDIRRALDFYRAFGGASPSHDYTPHNVS